MAFGSPDRERVAESYESGFPSVLHIEYEMPPVVPGIEARSKGASAISRPVAKK